MKICMRLFETFSNTVPHAFIPITYLKQGTPILRTHITLSKGKRQEVRAFTHFLRGSSKIALTPVSNSAFKIKLLQFCIQEFFITCIVFGITLCTFLFLSSTPFGYCHFMHSVQKYPFFGSFGYIKELLSNAYLIPMFLHQGRICWVIV